MRFAQTEMFHWLWLAVPLAFFLLWVYRHKGKMMQRFAGGLVNEITEGFSFKRQRNKLFFLFFCCVFSVIALSRPQWGFRWEEVTRQGLDILVAIDTSKSMLTQDVKPNRLERTKLAVMDLLKKLKGDRIGLIAFAGEAFLTCPLTHDYNGFLLSLNDLSTNTIPKGGTAIGKAITEAINSYKDIASEYKAVIIVTDGENLEGDPLKIARKAKEKGIKVYCVGIGTKEGELIRVKNERGQFEFLKDGEGNFVKSRLNERLLERIALATDGIYVRASGAQFGLDLIYTQELSKMEKREIESKRKKRYHERFQIPLAIAFLLLLTETFMSAQKKK